MPLRFLSLILALAAAGSLARAAHAGFTPPLPARPPHALTGSQLARHLGPLTLAEREKKILEEIASGNVPDFWRRFATVRVSASIGGVVCHAEYEAAPDYLALGSDEDYFLAPLSPAAAGHAARMMGCALPTRKMVDDIHRAAPLKLEPRPMEPGPAMTTVEAFAEHGLLVLEQRRDAATLHPPGTLASGHKKDVVVTPALRARPGSVAIYGWHRQDGRPIQPLYLGHTKDWVDYSHGVRLISRRITIDGRPADLHAAMADRALAPLFSDEGAFIPPLLHAPAIPPEITEERLLPHGVRAVINRPGPEDPSMARPLRLILYALPNGSTVEQTAGRHPLSSEEWRYGIQHIAAQTRWLRAAEPESGIIVCYLQCEGLSWPAWRKKHDPQDRLIPQIVDALRQPFSSRMPRLVLTGHSGGGSFTFGYLNGVDRIAEDIERIAFLDSNYAYDASAGHARKLAEWLGRSRANALAVLAYHDSVALLEGKPFVSETGGTWGRSHAMRQDLCAYFPFVMEADATWQRTAALEGRVQFWLRENPRRAILHTRLVEWNGFLHAMLTGTPRENTGYLFGGSRAYTQWIE